MGEVCPLVLTGNDEGVELGIGELLWRANEKGLNVEVVAKHLLVFDKRALKSENAHCDVFFMGVHSACLLKRGTRWVSVAA